MGKIRIKALGTENEAAQKEKGKIRREEKKKRLIHLANLKGGQKVVDMSATTESTEKKEEITETSVSSTPVSVSSAVAKLPKAHRQRSIRYLTAKKLIDHGKFYSISEAIELVKKTSFSKFDGSVETHINTTEKGIRGQVSLPHETGRQIKVAIASDQLLEEIEHNRIDFDILVATPSMMPKLAKVAKILGPKGLMPNPKNGTITNDPEGFTLSVAKGQIQFKTESEAPIIHLVLGKVSFPTKDLTENFQALISAIGEDKIKSAFIKATMSPSIKVAIDKS